jgi:hypothetical protein
MRGREKRGGVGVNCTLGLGFFLFILVFFLMLEWLNRFGSVRFNRFQTLETETELNRDFF